MEDDRAGGLAAEPAPALSTRRRTARLAVVALVMVLAVLLLESWHARAVDAELVHRFAAGNPLLPADIEVQVWEGDRLHADAWFPRPESLAGLRHTVRVPPGAYRVTYSVVRNFGEPELELERTVTVEHDGVYYLDYALEE